MEEVIFQKYKALKVSQPLGEFFIASIPVEVLLKVTQSNPLKYREIENKLELIGNQRELKDKKLKELGKYIDGEEAAFPNSIVIAANYDEYGIVDNENRWKIEEDGDGNYLIAIPTDKEAALLIDGQHRLQGFKFASNFNRVREVELPCSIYFDLPSPYQAYLFATINYNQTPVNKSLVYELYGFDTENADPNTWAPDTLAVYITRILNFNNSSPLYRHIIVAPQQDKILEEYSDKTWNVSTATFVEGIISLISSNNKRDRDEINKVGSARRKRQLLQVFKDKSPLRDYYLEAKDHIIIKVVENFFTSFIANISYHPNSYLFKTVGIQALFDMLRTILKENLHRDKNISVQYFDTFINKIKDVDFSDSFFRSPSGSGRRIIRTALELALGFKNLNEVDQPDRDDFLRLIPKHLLDQK